METADNSMDVLDARDGLRLPDCVDDAAMAARGKNDETSALDQKIGPDLVLEIVRNSARIPGNPRELSKG